MIGDQTTMDPTLRFICEILEGYLGKEKKSLHFWHLEPSNRPRIQILISFLCFQFTIQLFWPCINGLQQDKNMTTSTLSKMSIRIPLSLFVIVL